MEDINLRMILIKIGISSNIKGFYYILDAVDIIRKQQIHTNMITVYEMISKKQDTTSSAIERGIRHAIKTAYKHSNILKSIYEIVPDNSSFMYDLAFNFDVFEKYIKENVKE